MTERSLRYVLVVSSTAAAQAADTVPVPPAYHAAGPHPNRIALTSPRRMRRMSLPGLTGSGRVVAPSSRPGTMHGLLVSGRAMGMVSSSRVSELLTERPLEATYAVWPAAVPARFWRSIRSSVGRSSDEIRRAPETPTAEANCQA
ncbi:MAG: hypothetical protein JWN15_2829 [Firmicutes bacterium]|nr:hypothetical protein [Bacillota bacterium]